MISVCMGVYNGEPYLREQLQSIAEQTRAADQVILCDDCSKDRSAALITDFINNLKTPDGWELVCNEQNKGYPVNFYYAMSLCSGDIVFLADQDDIWASQKIERMTAILKENQQMKALCCKFDLIAADGSDLHTVMQPTRSKDTGSLRQVDCDGVFYKCEWPGMVIAYQREWYEKRLEQWRGKNTVSERYPAIPHDFLICAWAAEDEGFYQLDEAFAWHRRHDNNTGKEEHRLSRLINRERKLREIEEYNAILDQFEEQRIMQTEHGKQALLRKHSVMRERYEALKSGKVSRVLSNAWKNRRFTRAATFVCDLLIVLTQRKAD